jgi:predicted Zn-dependent peptidase
MMRFPPPEFKPPKAERMVLKNGMVLYLMEDHELPLINLQAMIRTGSIYDPPDQVGLAGLTAGVMRTGGTANQTGDEVDALLDQMAAGLSVGAGLDAGFASLDVLKKDFDTGLALFADILMHPVFEEEKLTVAKNQAIELIRRKNDHPGAIASREFGKLVYGEDHPFAREASGAMIEKIKRDDLAAFHDRYFAPNTMMVGVTGDFGREEMIKKIESAFAGWRSRPEPPRSVPAVPERFAKSVNMVVKEITQTQIRIGHVGIRQDNPDFFALSVMNDILGGSGFTSRMFKEVRTKQGLAYSAGTSIRPGNLEKGVFVAYAETRAETTSQAIATMMDQIRKIREEKVSAAELKRAKDAFLNSFIFSFSSPAQIVGQQMSLEYYGMPPDFLERYRDNVAKVTAEDIQRVARKYLHPDGLIALVVGDEKRFDRPLSTLGSVKTISLKEEPAVEK